MQPAQSTGQTTASEPARRAKRFLSGRTAADGSSFAHALDRARAGHAAMLAKPRTANLTVPWLPVGPAQVASLSYGNVTGRVTSIAIDPADATGNTVYVGTTGGGVWKSTNAAGPASAVRFSPLTDTLPVFSASAGGSTIPSLSIGAIAVANGVVLAGTGDPNDATDSYYGRGILRSADGGVTWTLAQESHDGVAGNHTFFGLGTAALAFSGANPSLAVAAMTATGEGTLVNAPSPTNSVAGLYYSDDAGQTWQMASVMDGSQPVQVAEPLVGAPGNPATAVVWNAMRQRFYAAVQYHGFYESTNGATWTRLANQPGTGFALSACPTNPGSVGSANCPIFRGVLAVQPATGDTFALAVDGNDLDQGLRQDVCGWTGSACATSDVTFSAKLPSAALEVGNGSAAIPQGGYDLTLAAVASGTDTLLSRERWIYTGVRWRPVACSGTRRTRRTDAPLRRWLPGRNMPSPRWRPAGCRWCIWAMTAACGARPTE